jgi:hypothetical protein
METGASLIVSKTTPLTLRDDSIMMVSDLVIGIELPVFYDDGRTEVPFWDKVLDIEEMGELEVALISVGGHSYAAGETAGAYIYTHNKFIAKV